MFNTLISVTDLANQLKGRQNIPDDQWAIIDCRFSLADTRKGETAYRQAHLPGAYYAHLDRDLSGVLIAGKTGRHPLPIRSALCQRFCDWGISNTTQIVAYDDCNGAIASRFWWLSRWLGHTSCAVVDGGLAAWQAQGLPLTSERSPTVQKRTFQATDAQVKIAEIDQVAGTGVFLIDAREAHRFAGLSEPIDPVAGRIPGAHNAPFEENLQYSGLFKNREQLRLRFQPLLDAAQQRQLVHYCGSGVSAAHNILAMAHAGLDAGALYPGSFSEWITRDPRNYPVAP